MDIYGLSYTPFFQTNICYTAPTLIEKALMQPSIQLTHSYFSGAATFPSVISIDLQWLVILFRFWLWNLDLLWNEPSGKPPTCVKLFQLGFSGQDRSEETVILGYHCSVRGSGESRGAPSISWLTGCSTGDTPE